MSKKHTHKYHRVDTDRGPIWACGLPECSHFMPSHYTKLLLGKASFCWECGSSMVLTEANMKNAHPVCVECTGLAGLADVIKENTNTP